MPLNILIFSLIFWLGLYLITRDLRSPHLRFAGIGLVGYAFGWACTILSVYTPRPTLGLMLIRGYWILFAFSNLFFMGAFIFLLSQETPLRSLFTKIWSYGILPVIIFCSVLAISTPLLFNSTSGLSQLGPGYLILSAVALLPLLGALYLLWRERPEMQPKKAWGVLFASLLLFLLGPSLLLFPHVWSVHTWILLVMGIDLLLLGGIVAIVDAIDQGEALLPDIFRSFDFSFGTVVLFAGQVVLVMLLGTGLTFPLLVLLVTIIATAIVVQAFWKQVAALVDRVAFAYFPQIRQARADLRAAATTLTRVNSEVDFETLDEVEFIRLTRRALSHFGDLSRLAASPLTRLPIVEMRLARQGAKDDSLRRAIELKTVLVESIARLKPQNKGDFGTSDEWRYYNALYFPYVVGLKPYSSRAQNGHLDLVAQKALEWFRTMVPERTLHNWQNAATKLVAQDLRSKSF